jgi:hypothetical protein
MVRFALEILKHHFPPRAVTGDHDWTRGDWVPYTSIHYGPRIVLFSLNSYKGVDEESEMEI